METQGLPLKKQKSDDTFLLAQISVPPMTPEQERKAARVVALCVPRSEVKDTLAQLGLLTRQGRLAVAR